MHINVPLFTSFRTYHVLLKQFKYIYKLARSDAFIRKDFHLFYLLCFTACEACEEIGNRASHASREALLPGKNATNDVICHVHDGGCFANRPINDQRVGREKNAKTKGWASLPVARFLDRSTFLGMSYAGGRDSGYWRES
jgi:hypothetical protein